MYCLMCTSCSLQNFSFLMCVPGSFCYVMCMLYSVEMWFLVREMLIGKCQMFDSHHEISY